MKARAAWIPLLAGSLAWPVLAQSDKPLSGPPVTTDRPSHLQDSFSNDAKEGKREPMNERGVPMRQYLDIIGKLRGEGAPEGLRLSAEQDTKIDAIADEFRQAVRAYAEKARGEDGPAVRRRGQRAPAPVDAKPGGKETEPMDEAGQRPRANRERMEELRKNAPKPVDYELKMWALLSKPQQAFVDGEVDKLRQQREKEMGEEYMKRQIEKRRGEKTAAPVSDPGRPGAEGGGAVRERVQRVIERLRQLPPEQREEVLRRLEEELDKRGVPAAEGGDRPAGRPGRPGGKDADPAPPPPKGG